MARSRSSKPPKPSGQRVPSGYREVTLRLADQVAGKLKACAAIRDVNHGVIVEEALKVYLRRFYVVDGGATAPDVTAEAVRLVVAESVDVPAYGDETLPAA